MPRLSPDTLCEVAPEVRLPAYAREAVGAGIVHLGIGAFHRAHQALYTDELLARHGGDWGIIGVSLRSACVAQQLQPQAGLYSLLSVDAQGQSLRVIGAVKSVLVATREPDALVAAIADPAIQVITLTITEKGYCIGADGRSLNTRHADVAYDLRNPGHPRTALGFLALGLHRRMAHGGPALTLLSCDNLAQNSRVLRAVLIDYLQRTWPEVVTWLEQRVRFPCSVVDRIVPAMTAARREQQEQALGLCDAGAVAAEPFCQWIIEDDFAAARPPWDVAGAQFVDSVAPYEAIKLRLLNASHSAIACLGLLVGAQTVDAVMAQAPLRGFIDGLMTRELMPTLQVPAHFDLAAYKDTLLQRFDNPWLAHRCAQIAMDSSEKIAQRWLPTLQISPSPALVAALSLWCAMMLLTDTDVEDAQAGPLLRARASGAALAQRIGDVLACARITPASVADFDHLLAMLVRNLDNYQRCGVSGVLDAPASRATA